VRSLANKGTIPIAKSWLAYCYSEGCGIEQDETQVEALLSDQDDWFAFYLKLHYMSSEDASYLPRETFLTQCKAAHEQGNPHASYILASYLAKWEHIENNEIIDLYSKAAEQGHSWAQVKMGNCMIAEKKEKKAVLFYEAASNQGDPSGMSRLAACYENGQGVKQDMDTARALYLRAEALGVQRI